jgi:nucleotide-binding universal stress UspA family protein
MKPKKRTGYKILVAIDGSRYSPKALDYACKIAKIDNAQLQIINVVEEYFNIGLSISRQLDRTSKEILQEYKALAKSSGVMDVTVIQARGYAAEEILNTAIREKVDTIVVGSRGHYPSKMDFILGSTSYKLAHYSRCTVIIVK